LAQGLLTHLDRVPVDAELAVRQWSDYTRALTEAGWDTVEVPAAPECPDGVFVEDTVVMIGGTAVITSPGADERKPETMGTSVTVRALGYPTATLDAGTLDGGDVLKIGRTVYVGRTLRTSAEGIASLRRICEPLGHRVVAVPTTKVLHLKSAVTALPDGTVIGYEPLVDDPGFWPHFRPMPEEGGSHVPVGAGAARPGRRELTLWSLVVGTPSPQWHGPASRGKMRRGRVAPYSHREDPREEDHQRPDHRRHRGPQGRRAGPRRSGHRPP
jgi:dimethylargininase